MNKPMKNYVISIILTILAIAIFYYVIIYHGTRTSEIYDIGRETKVEDFDILQLQKNIPIEQHFVSNTYSLKGINYILLGVDEETNGELEFCIQSIEGEKIFSKIVEYSNILPGQWENVELPAHLLQGREYILKVTNLSDEVEPIILTSGSDVVSQMECGMWIDNQIQAEQLILGFGFRPEFSRAGKITICFMIVCVWCFGIYNLLLKKKNRIDNSAQNTSETRKHYYDFLRLMAIGMVIYNHIVQNGFMLFTEEQGTVIFWIEQSFSIFIKIAVPIFWMMSGALLLVKEEDIKTLFKKRISRFVIVLILFTAIQYAHRYYTGRLDMETDGNYFKWVYEYCDAVPAYWYLYAYLGYLFMLPVLRKIARGLKRKEFQYVFIIYTVYTGILPLFEYFILKEQYHLRSDFQIPVLASSCITFSLLGYYVEHIKKEEEFELKKWLGWLIASIVSIAVTAMATTYRCELNHKWSEVFTQYFFNCFIIVPTYTVFYGVKLWSMKHRVNLCIRRIGSILGGATFGLMLIENIIREWMNFVFDLLVPHFGKFLGGILWVISIVLVGTTVMAVIRLLPILKKLL